jgi:hypothetical protein
MKRFVEGEDRLQGALLPHCLDDYVTENNPVRVIEAFINELDLATAGILRRLRRCVRCSVGASREPGDAWVPRRRESGHGRTWPGLIYEHGLAAISTADVTGCTGKRPI